MAMSCSCSPSQRFLTWSICFCTPYCDQEGPHTHNQTVGFSRPICSSKLKYTSTAAFLVAHFTLGVRNFKKKQSDCKWSKEIIYDAVTLRHPTFDVDRKFDLIFRFRVHQLHDVQIPAWTVEFRKPFFWAWCMWKTLLSTQAPLRTWAWRSLVACCGPRTSFSFPSPTSHSFLLRSTSCWRIARHLAKVDVVCKSNLMSCLFALNATERKIYSSRHYGKTCSFEIPKASGSFIPVCPQSNTDWFRASGSVWLRNALEQLRQHMQCNQAGPNLLSQAGIATFWGVCGVFLSFRWAKSSEVRRKWIIGVQCAWPSQGRSWTATWSVQYLSLHWLSQTLASQSGTSLLHTMGIADPWPGRGARRYQIAKAYIFIYITSLQNNYHDMIWYDMKWNDPPI